MSMTYEEIVAYETVNVAYNYKAPFLYSLFFDSSKSDNQYELYSTHICCENYPKNVNK